MTTRRTYECNICHDHIEQETGIGLLYVTGKFKKVHVREAENHICNKCIVNIVEISHFKEANI